MAEKSAAEIAPYTKHALLLRKAVKYAAAFHDLGKLDDENQEILRRGKGKLPINHVDGGVAYLLSRPSVLRNLSALNIYSHHVGLPSLPAEAAKGKGRIFRDEELKEIIDERLSRYLEIHKSDVGLLEVPDIVYDGSALTPLLMRIALSCLVDADHTDTARHYNNVVPEGEIPLLPGKRLELLDRYVKELGIQKADNTRSDLRSQIYGACRHAKPSAADIMACDSPVGTGKTTAVMAHLLSAAQGKKLRRVFVVLPFTNIIDQSVNTYREAVVMEGDIAEKVVAAHHHRADFADLETRAFSFLWNAPIIVTTAVQFFETLSSNHPASLRKLHQLPGSAIFLDEAHAALPAHLWPQAWKWLEELVRDWRCYLVMASGSLTRFWEIEEFSSPPIKLDELVNPDVREKAHKEEKLRINYRKKDKALELIDLCKWIEGLPGPRLVILNTVHSAAAIARQLADRKSRANVEHLSTALAPMHRGRTVDNIKQRLADKNDIDWTLVATSCVEAGMDFSFRSAAREFCSLVSTVQTAGRINRSGEFKESDLWTFKIVPGNNLKEHPKFKLSAAVLEELFDEDMVAPQYCKEAMKREVRRSNRGGQDADPIVIAERNKEFFDVAAKFKVIDSDTVTAVIDRETILKLKDLKNKGKLSPDKIQMASVQIWQWRQFEYALKIIDEYPGLFIWTLEYDEFLGYMAGVLEMERHKSEGSIV